MPVWVAPKSYSADAVLTASEKNIHDRDNPNVLKTSIDDLGNLSPPGSQELTIATGAITVVQNHHGVDTEADAATDDLTTITLGTDTRSGMIIFLVAQDLSHVVTIKEGGNIELQDGHDFLMDTVEKVIAFQHRAAAWYELFTSPVGSMTHNKLTMVNPPLVSVSPAVSQNDYAPGGLATASFLVFDGATAVNITGFDQTLVNHLLFVHVSGAGNITFKHDDSGSAAANRFQLGTDTTVATGSGILFAYLATRWRRISS